LKYTSASAEPSNPGKTTRQILVSVNAHATAKEMASAYGKDVVDWASELILAAFESAPADIKRAITTLRGARGKALESSRRAQVTR
jgi:hypothetical protein